VHPSSLVVPASVLTANWAWQPQQFRVTDSNKVLTAYEAYLAYHSADRQFVFHNAGYILDAYETYLTKATVDSQNYNYASIQSLDSLLITNNGLLTGVTSPLYLLDAVSVRVEKQLRTLMDNDTWSSDGTKIKRGRS